MPNVSGGLVTSKIEQRTDWRYDYNRKLARLAERNGFEYALSQVRYMASYGAEFQHESTSFSLALLLATERLKVIAAVHPGLWHPGVLAKWVATADHLSGGRVAVNVVSGWFKDEFTPARRALAGARRALPPLRGVHPRARGSGPRTTPSSPATSTGSATSASSPSRCHGRAGRTRRSSRAATRPPRARNGGRVSDWYFTNGKDFDGVARAARRRCGRTPRRAGRTDGPGSA